MAIEGIYLARDGNAYVKYFHEGENYYSLIEDNFEIYAYLGEPVELEEGYTLRNYFQFLCKFSCLWLLDKFTVDYMREYFKCPSEGCIYDDEEIHYLALERIVNYENFGYRKDEEDDWKVEDRIDFHGKGDETYGIEFSPLNKLLDYKIKIEPAQISIEHPGDFTDYDDLTEKYEVYTGEDIQFTLFEFVKSIIWELSFCGTPEDRENKNSEIQESLDEAMKELKEKGE